MTPEEAEVARSQKKKLNHSNSTAPLSPTPNNDNTNTNTAMTPEANEVRRDEAKEQKKKHSPDRFSYQETVSLCCYFHPSTLSTQPFDTTHLNINPLGSHIYLYARSRSTTVTAPPSSSSDLTRPVLTMVGSERHLRRQNLTSRTVSQR